MTRSFDALMTSIHSANLPSGRRDKPVPKIASTTASAPSSRRSLETSTPVRRRATSSLAAAPWSRARSTQLTRRSFPQRCRCRAAASPSPALLPTPHTTVVAPGQERATCQPAASISHSTEMPKRSCASASTSLTWWLVSVGGALDDKGAVGVVTVNGVGLRDVGAKQPRHQLRSDGAALGELERRVAERTVVNGHLHAFSRLRLLRQGAGPADPGHHPAHLLVELEALEGGFDGSSVPGGHPGEDLVQSLGAAHRLYLLEHHGGELPVALGKHGVGPLGEREEQRRPSAAAALRVADDKPISLEVGEVLADRVRSQTEIARDAFRA